MDRILGCLTSLAVLAFAVQPASSAELPILPVKFPKLVETSPSADGFVPRGWRPELEVRGDLNRDKLPDVVLVMQENNAANVFDTSLQGGSKHFDTNPRILAIALAEPGGEYRLAVENHALIPRLTHPNADDYLDFVDVDSGAIRVRLRVFMNSGGWTASSMTFTFRYRAGTFKLVGYDSSDVVRNTGETKDVSVNYLTDRMKIANGNISSEGADKVVWKQLPKRALLTMEQVGDGLTFNPKSE